MRKLELILPLLLISVCQLLSQTDDIYIRLTMPASERPLSLYKGQFQIKTEYQHSIGTSKYDRFGTKESFTETASNILSNDYFLSISFGISDFIELQASLPYINQVETLPTISLWNYDKIVEINTLYHTTGIEDLDINLKLRQPFFNSWIDFSVLGGISLAVTAQDPRVPQHNLILFDPNDPGGDYFLNYLYKNKPGNNTLFLNLGIESKVMVNRFSISAAGFYKAPVKEEESIFWSHRVYEENFAYLSDSFSRLPNSLMEIYFAPSFQVFPWFSAFALYYHHKQNGGWTEQHGSRISLTGTVTGTIVPGFEIQVSTKLRFLQTFSIPVYGKNEYAIFSLRTGMVINLVPFTRYYE